MNETVTRLRSDWTPEEMRLLLASMISKPPEQVCAYVAVVVLHPEDGPHKLCLIAPDGNTDAGLAQLLTHAAAHVTGHCRACRKAKRRYDREHR